MQVITSFAPHVDVHTFPRQLVGVQPYITGNPSFVQVTAMYWLRVLCFSWIASFRDTRAGNTETAEEAEAGRQEVALILQEFSKKVIGMTDVPNGTRGPQDDTRARERKNEIANVIAHRGHGRRLVFLVTYRNTRRSSWRSVENLVHHDGSVDKKILVYAAQHGIRFSF